MRSMVEGAFVLSVVLGRGALPRQCRIDARPALGALGVEAFDGGIDLAVLGLGHAAKVIGSQFVAIDHRASEFKLFQ